MIKGHLNHLKVGVDVGLGWRARSCLVCDRCLSGQLNRYLKGEHTIIGSHEAYADKIRITIKGNVQKEIDFERRRLSE